MQYKKKQIKNYTIMEKITKKFEMLADYILDDERSKKICMTFIMVVAVTIVFHLMFR